MSHSKYHKGIVLPICLNMLPIITLCTFLFSSVISLGSDEKFFSFSNLCIIEGCPIALGIIATVYLYFSRKPIMPIMDFLAYIKYPWIRCGIIMIGAFLVYGVISLSLLDIFSEDALNIIRLLLMFGGPIIIGLLTLMALLNIEEP